MRIGCLVLLTRSSNARHFALNSEMGTSVIRPLHGHQTTPSVFRLQYHTIVRIIVRIAGDSPVVPNRGPVTLLMLLMLRPFALETIQGCAGGCELLGSGWGFRPGPLLQFQN